MSRRGMWVSATRDLIVNHDINDKQVNVIYVTIYQPWYIHKFKPCRENFDIYQVDEKQVSDFFFAW